jgi:hypothetical protein
VALDAQDPKDASLALQAGFVRSECALARGDAALALKLIAPALALKDGPPPKRWLRARALFQAARALRAAGREPTQAVALATRARDVWVKTRDARLADVEAWLAAGR